MYDGSGLPGGPSPRSPPLRSPLPPLRSPLPPRSRALSPHSPSSPPRAAARFTTGVGEPTRAAALANEVMSVSVTHVKLGLMLAVLLAVVALGVVATATTQAPPAARPARRDAEPAVRAVAQRPAEAPKAEFEEVTVVSTPGFLSNRTRETVRVSADGTCLYEVPELPARGEIAAWSGAKIVHKLPPARLAELNTLLKRTEWLAKDAQEKPQLHHPEFALTLMRGGKTIQLILKGESEPYAKLMHFFQSVAAQEYITYRLEWVPAAQVEGRRELDNLVAAELGEPFARPPLTIDLTRFAPWATRLVRRPFGESTDDVRTAIRLIGLLRLESERAHLADLANDRDRSVRLAVAAAVGRLGGDKAVSVLRKMVRSTGTEAAWDMINLGPVAVPTIADVIREGTNPKDDLSYEWLIRAYIAHWTEVAQPLAPEVLDAVRTSMAAPKVQALRTVYHAELLKLAASASRKE